MSENKISLGMDSSTINKKDYFAYKDHYRCPHAKCTSVLSRQCWNKHVEMHHIDGQKIFSRDKNQEFKCFRCPQSFKTRAARETHRIRAHN